MEDRTIIDLFYERDEQAISELSHKYERLFRKVADHILNNKEDVEEVLNDAYLATWNTIPPENPNPLPTYVCHIVRNQSLKKYYKNTAKKRNSTYDQAFDELDYCFSHNNVEEEINKQELIHSINTFLSQLPKENRVLFIRRYYYCNTIKELARLMHMNQHNISVRLFRIREELKEYLEQEGIV